MSKHYLSTTELARFATNAIFGISGCVIFAAAKFFINVLIGPVGMVIGGIAAILGLTGLFSADKNDRRDGLTVFVTGALFVIIAAELGPVRFFAGYLLSAGAFMSFAFGVWNGIRFLIGFKRRSS
ncbi:MAG: hypothetical protein LBD07_01150 [Spirochaetaceae bacterium]|jgi:hypothetical protein|nr:hypothetical protein [Spirochaetaceae bacterium]